MTATPLERAREIAHDVLTEILRRMEIPATLDIEADDDEIRVELRSSSEDVGRLLGRDAYLLDALQHLTQAAIRRGAGEEFACLLDLDGRRAHRARQLSREAFDAAELVRRTKRPFTFGPMSAGDRKAIHRALSGETDLETLSGDADFRGLKRLTVRLRLAGEPAAAGADSIVAD